VVRNSCVRFDYPFKNVIAREARRIWFDEISGFLNEKVPNTIQALVESQARENISGRNTKYVRLQYLRLKMSPSTNCRKLIDYK